MDSKPSFYRYLVTLTVLLFITACSDSSADREYTELSDGWQFSMGENSETVSIPHSWNRVGFYDNDLIENRSDIINKTMGEAVYKRDFSVDVADGKQAWLEFDGVSRIAKVYVNGNYVGRHDGPFTRFRFNITEFLHDNGEANTLTVEVDNTKPTADSTTSHVLPIAGDFFVAGGIYRSARLVVTNNAHFAMTDYGSTGVYSKVTSITDKSATVLVNALIEAESDLQPSHVQVSLADESGNVVAEKSVSLQNNQDKSSLVLEVQNPKLWGVNAPYLYELTATLLKDKSALDTVSFPIGIRTAEATAEGFFVNGEKVLIKGVGYHQDNYLNGWAALPEDTQKDFSLLTDMGINSIRLSHYPHGQTIHKLANEAGVLLWDEIPLVSFWNYGTEKVEQQKALEENAIMQLREMVKQNYNHPSVVMWGIANEVDFAKAAPAFIGTTVENLGSPIPLLEKLNAEAKRLDTRQTAIANCCQGVASMAPLAMPEVMDVPDIIGANRYFGWYFGKPADFSDNLDELHQLGKPVSVSEYGGGGAISLHTDNIHGGKINAAGFAQPEEYMSYLHEQAWSIISSKPWIMGAWIWNAFDFSTTIRNEGDSKDINTKGIITADRKILKDSYYYYQAQWSDKPVVHITSKRYEDRLYPVMDVKVYSNATSTSLSINGQTLAAKPTCDNFVCVWNNVPLSVGDNAVVATGKFNGKEVTDSASFQFAKERHNTFNINAGYIITENGFGSDHFFDGGEGKGMDVHASWRGAGKIADIKSDLPHDVVANYREGTFTYQLPLKQGEYEITLVFVEPDTGKKSGERIFSVAINDNTIVDNLDLIDEVNAAHTEYQVTKTVTTDGGLTIEFTPQVGQAVVSAIMVRPN